MLYLISYDLESASSKEYKKLQDTLVQHGAQQLLKSQWVIHSDATNADELGNWIMSLGNFTSQKDRLLVIPLEITVSAWHNLMIKIESF